MAASMTKLIHSEAWIARSGPGAHFTFHPRFGRVPVEFGRPHEMRQSRTAR